ncbi:DinB family protein [Staphylococcus succinus]|uniref:DinB family protein n=1 Tax=Staphylococcus succinus TaxID=61015 RepID=UPI000C330742|nr:DinB family protein [Staphylococcus succinus]MBU0437056.1 DinB family protein [Staphylococcus succinus]MEB7462042.1 DinB family protein [Staphylococcus succinus]PKI22635.1 DinB family protein [Staphylococcus succinus]PTI46434.1 DinB family protein [Staphylococcus succinus]PTJ85058.1 DinB family protein [Staphylococcus succinus]
MIRKQFQDSYNLLKKHIKDIDEEKATLQPAIANNNIKWQLGHLILLNDFLVFETINGQKVLEQSAAKYFLWGTSPINFDGNEPSFDELKVLLNEQLDRIFNSLEKQLEKDRNEPIVLKDVDIVMNNFNESIHFAIIHTNRHFGQIVLLKSMISELD